MRRGGGRLLGWILVSVLVGNGASAQVYELLAGDSAALNHYPGPDGLVVTADDTVSADITTVLGSDPNFHGAFSYAAAASGMLTDPALPNGAVASFLEGTVTVDPAVAGGMSGALITAFSAHGTDLRQGLSLGNITITNVNGGMFDPMTNMGNENVDLEIRIGTAGPTQAFAGVTLTGTAFVVDAADFATFNANTYVQNVLIPRAQAAGATSLLFLQVQGTLIGGLPLIVNPSAFSLTLAGLAGVPAANQADLEIVKSVQNNGVFMPGDTVVLRLSVTNNGDADATGVIVSDRFVPQVTWQSDTCGAGPPNAERVLTWNVGNLVNGATVVCDVTVLLEPDANFDQENGATVVSTTIDPDLSNNTSRVTIDDLAAAVNGLAQPPNGLAGFQSDASCGACPNGSQAMADNFKINVASRLTEIVFYGGYSDNVPFADNFTIQLHADNAENVVPGTPTVPGALITTIPGMVTRRATGGVILGFFTEFEYRITTDIPLDRGLYWILAYNDSAGAGGDWFWESGNTDAQNRSCPGIAANVQIPLTLLWNVTTTNQLAVEVRTSPAVSTPAPALAPAALGALALALLGLGFAAVRWRGGRRTSTRSV